MTEAGDGVVLENGRLRAELGADGLLRSLVERGSGREALAAPGQRAAAVRRPADRVRRLGRRPVPPRDGAPTCPPAERRSRAQPTRCAPRWPSSGRSAGPARMRQMVRLDAGSPPARVPLRGRLARAAHAAQGAVPGRRARRQRDLPDAVRPHRAADALLDQPRPGAVRGARPPLRRPLRAWLRRRASDRLQVRLLDVRRTRCGSACCARRPSPTPQADMGRAQVRLRRDAARRRLARGRRRGRGGALRDAARWVPAPAAPPLALRWTIPTSCWTRSSGPRTPTRWCCGCTRRTARRGTARIRVGVPFTGAELATCWRTPGGRCPCMDGAIELAYTPHQILSVLLW